MLKIIFTEKFKTKFAKNHKKHQSVLYQNKQKVLNSMDLNNGPSINRTVVTL